jgi:hypothetical protein
MSTGAELQLSADGRRHTGGVFFVYGSRRCIAPPSAVGQRITVVDVEPLAWMYDLRRWRTLAPHGHGRRSRPPPFAIGGLSLELRRPPRLSR